MRFFYNGQQYEQRQFKVLPQIKEGEVPLLDQTLYTDPVLHHYDHIYKNPCMIGSDPETCTLWPPYLPIGQPYTIKVKGCALTSLAMVLGYHGVKSPNDPSTPIAPDELNTLLKNSGGYSRWGNIRWGKIRALTGGRVTFAPELSFGNLADNICNYGPQMVGAEGSAGVPNSHFLAATGLDSAGHFLVNDPWRSSAKWYGELNTWTVSNSIRGFVGPDYMVTDPSGVTIRLHSPAELLVTDPQGRRLGVDPSLGQRYQEIPSSYYQDISLADIETGEAGNRTKELTFGTPLGGEYILDVIGTGSGMYAVEIDAIDEAMNDSLRVIEEVPVTPGERHRYRFTFSGVAGSPLEIQADFNGGGQSSKVNSLLSYSGPWESQTHLAAGATAYSVFVFYSRNILPQTFRAVLEGVDVTSMFHPVPGTNERVTIPLVSGRNLLHLTVDGNVGTRIASDSDRLIFVVP
ncbi:MAG: hypothetical protein HOP18_26095 [Deltaproteobacteria bacterium]|nr:hypothetical protein [Deltaproteobacteria bacterium]